MVQAAERQAHDDDHAEAQLFRQVAQETGWVQPARASRPRLQRRRCRRRQSLRDTSSICSSTVDRYAGLGGRNVRRDGRFEAVWVDRLVVQPRRTGGLQLESVVLRSGMPGAARSPPRCDRFQPHDTQPSTGQQAHEGRGDDGLANARIGASDENSGCQQLFYHRA